MCRHLIASATTLSGIQPNDLASSCTDCVCAITEAVAPLLDSGVFGPIDCNDPLSIAASASNVLTKCTSRVASALIGAGLPLQAAMRMATSCERGDTPRCVVAGFVASVEGACPGLVLDANAIAAAFAAPSA
jgi:hypothetical protein